MANKNLKPVILLAFANDKQEAGAGFLRLTEERNGIRDALAKAEEQGLCEVIVEPDVSIDRIFNAFQSKVYRDRIAIFHYAGHADSYKLLLESQSGTNVTAHTEGLVSFLAKQRGLQMVFLNGCSSQSQSEDLVKAGVPAVVGTSQKINDQVATSLSVRFYKGLAAGNEIGRAWEEAIDQVKTEKGTVSGTRSMLWDEEEDETPPDRFPWEIYYSEDNGFAEDWNLPAAAKDPLFGLDIPGRYFRKLPVTPYVGLRSFKQEEAAIFFGRGREIRELYGLLNSMQPVILFYGKAGVGKSSLLQAGLIPRVEDDYLVTYEERQASGLTDTLVQILNKLSDKYELVRSVSSADLRLTEKIAELRTALEGTSGFAREVIDKELQKLTILNRDNVSMVEQWHMIEEKTGKPLLIILDQLEASFSADQENLTKEWELFTETLRQICNTSHIPISGKIILSYRDEHHALMNEHFQELSLPYSEIYIPPLDWDGIVEAVEGVTLRPSTHDYYHLEIDRKPESSFPAIIADDLLEGDESPIAPILQVWLTDLWHRAVRENARSPQISVRMYQEFKHSGAVMISFFRQQLAKLHGWQREVVESGLILDLLYHHTTPLGTTEKISQEKLWEIYQDREGLIGEIMAMCQDLYLVTSVRRRITSLSHHFLAPVLIKEHSVSVRPGQQATRILSSKIEEFRSKESGIWLNDADLDIVEKGLGGMRKLDGDETALLEISRQLKIKREKDRKRRRIIASVLVAVIFLFAILAAWQWRVSVTNFNKSKSNELAFVAKELFNTDNTKALRVAYEAYNILSARSSPTVTQTISEIFHTYAKMPFYAAVFSHRETVNSAVFSSDGAYVLTASEDGFAKLWDTKGVLLDTFSHDGYDVLYADFSPNGKQILTITKSEVRLWELDGTLVDSDSLPEGQIPDLKNFSTDGTRIVPAPRLKEEEDWNILLDTLRQEHMEVIPAKNKSRILVSSYDQVLKLCDDQGNVLKDSLILGYAAAAFGPDDKQFLSVSFSYESDTSIISIWDENIRLIYSFQYKGEVKKAVFSPDGKKILTASRDQTAKLWDFSEKPVHQLPRQGAVKSAEFSPDGTMIVTASQDKMVRLWSANGILLDSLRHEGVVNAAVFSPDGKRILTASRDYTARLWTPGDHKTVILPHQDIVSSATYSPDGSRILTGSLDTYARLWTADGFPVDSFKHEGEVNTAVFSPDGKMLLTTSRDLYQASLWLPKDPTPIIFKHQAEVNAAVFSPDGKQVLTASDDGRATLWSIKGDSIISYKETAAMKVAIFSPDGRSVLTGGVKEMVKIWDLKGKLRDSLAHEAVITSIMFSPDGKKILTAAKDQTARLWNDKGSLLAEYQCQSQIVNRSIFSPDGKKILTADESGYAIVWWAPYFIYDWLKKAPVYSLNPEEKDLYSIPY
ncbi:MAG: AAA family ATPase [Bacteroidia bacterium]